MQDFIIQISAIQLPPFEVILSFQLQYFKFRGKNLITMDIFNDIPVSLPSLTKQKERTTAAAARKINTLCVCVCVCLSLTLAVCVCVCFLHWGTMSKWKVLKTAHVEAFMSLYHRGRSKS